MQILLCPTCGSLGRTGDPRCTGCGGSFSELGATPISPSALAGKPLTISGPADPMVLERIICKKRLRQMLDGNGNQLDDSDRETTEIDPLNNGFNRLSSSPSLSTPENGDGNGNGDKGITDSAQATQAQEPSSSKRAALSPADLDFFAQNPPPPPYISNSFILPDSTTFSTSSTNSTSVQSQSAASTTISADPESGTIAEVNDDRATSIIASPDTPESTPVAPTEEVSKEGVTKVVPEPGTSVKPQQQLRTAGTPKAVRGAGTTSSAAESHASTAFRYPAQLMTLLENGIVIAGHRRSIAGFAIGLVVVLFLGNILVGTVSGLFNGVASYLPGQQLQQVLTGQWVTNYVYRGRPFQGRMIVQQSGNQLTGYGRDPAYFEFIGTQSGDQVHLSKTYINPSNKSRIGFPVTLDGVITRWNGERLNMHGIYVTSLKQGVFLHARIETIQGNWQADLVSTVIPKIALQRTQESGNSFIPSLNKTKDFQGFLMNIAGVFLFIGFAIVLASLKLFGPNGLVNIWAKKEYIPSQFKSHHHKTMWELSKPARPGSVPLGERLDWSWLQFYKPKKLSIPPEVRRTNPHILILGGGDKGKSRLMANMIIHDIQDNDRAVVVVDSDGGLVDHIMRWIASQPPGHQYAEQVVLVDPTHSGTVCLGYNPLEMPEDGDLQAAASAIVFGFKAVYTEPPGSQSQWNQQTANILRNAALLLMVNGKTLTDLPVLLSDNDFRDVLLDNVEKRKHEHVEYISLLEAWNQYKRLARTDQWINWVEPILNRVSPMLSDPRIRSILTKPKGELKLREIISRGKTLLVKVPHGQLDQNADLLGSLLVTGLKQAALSLSNGGVDKHPCSLYLDEFDNFIEKETFEAFTHETSKFQIGLMSAIKTLQNLPEDFRNQLVINVGTICAFSLGKKDADMLGPQMFRVDGRKIKHQTLQNIFNRVNSSFHFELISDEEKLNIDRVIGLEQRTFFCYRVGSIAGVFLLRAYDFPDIPDERVDHALIDHMYVADNVQVAPAAGPPDPQVVSR